MSNKRKRTLRVPKKVAERAAAALAERHEAGIGLESAPEVLIAAALSSSLPVTTDVPSTMTQFFTSDWRYNPSKQDKAALYGGEAGQRWANNVSAMLGLKEPDTSLDDEMSTEEIFTLTDEEEEAVREFLEALSPVVPKAEEVLEKLDEEPEEESEPKAELSIDELTDVVDGAPEPTEADPVDELGEHVETALGLATQLDDTIEKLAVALDEALEETEEEPADPEAEAVEMSMVQDALAEVGAEVDAIDSDFAVMAAEARERMATAALVRERSQAMAKMASARLTLATEAPAAAAPEGVGAPTDAAPKAPGVEHHAQRQVRDWHGRFASAGARVRSKDGNLGYIKKVDENGQLVIMDDEGNEHTVDPKAVEVISTKSPARLSAPQPVLEDPKARTDAYLQWAQDQMGVT